MPLNASGCPFACSSQQRTLAQMVKKLRPRMVPRRVSKNFPWAVSGEPLAHAAEVTARNKVGGVLAGLCDALGRSCEETSLVFQG